MQKFSIKYQQTKLKISKKNYTVPPSGIYPRYDRLVQYFKKSINPLHQQAKEEKSCDIVSIAQQKHFIKFNTDL